MATSKKGKRRVRFQVTADPGSTVSVAGTFNDWTPDTHPLKDSDGSGTYEKIMYVPRGRHEYKFVINDSWRIDPDCPEWTSNDFGTLNSIIEAN